MNNPSSSSSRTSVPSRRSGDTEDVTWLDFLRTAGGTAPADSSASTDRKRRHAGSSPERRGYPYPAYNPAVTGRRPSGLTAAPPTAGASRESAIDLTTPPRLQRPPLPQIPSEDGSDSLRGARLGIRRAMPAMPRDNMTEIREGDIVLPRWQPDSEISKCPVCQTEFHFFYRKHHCRKCGRVVCAACSPHRITIPRQYIVQPPSTLDSDADPVSPTRNLGGGEVVRVCNPCVPDPWTPDTAAENHTRPQADTIRRRESSGEGQRADRYRYNQPLPPPPPPRDPGRVRSQSHQPVPNFAQSAPHQPAQHTSGFVFRGPYNRPPQLPPPLTRPISHRQTQSTTNAPLPPIPPFNAVRQAPVPPLSAPPQARPRREIREEDECPVCGTELPAGARVREEHIQECIAARFSSTPSSSHPFAPPPPLPQPHPPRTSNISRSGTGSEDEAPAASTSAPTEPISRPRATSYRPRGMAVYRATEKDCMTEDSEPQECVICFEEFQPGDEMGRMECLCKFHRTCIRRWWDTKGNGSCPTHQLHD